MKEKNIAYTQIDIAKINWVTYHSLAYIQRSIIRLIFSFTPSAYKQNGNQEMQTIYQLGFSSDDFLRHLQLACKVYCNCGKTLFKKKNLAGIVFHQLLK